MSYLIFLSEQKLVNQVAQVLPTVRVEHVNEFKQTLPEFIQNLNLDIFNLKETISSAIKVPSAAAVQLTNFQFSLEVGDELVDKLITDDDTTADLIKQVTDICSDQQHTREFQLTVVLHNAMKKSTNIYSFDIEEGASKTNVRYLDAKLLIF